MREYCICEKCIDSILDKFFFCEKCGSPSFFRVSECGNCLDNVIYYRKMIFLYAYNGAIKKILREIKYNPKSEIFKNFDLIFHIFLSSSRIKDLEEVLEKVDFVLPVPIHENRKRIRGYNQSVILSEVIRICFNKDYYENILIKEKDTKFFFLLDKTDRKKEIYGAFSISDKSFIKGKNILLVDDISTTGATFNTISKLLLDNGAKKVYAFSLAHGF